MLRMKRLLKMTSEPWCSGLRDIQRNFALWIQASAKVEPSAKSEPIGMIGW
jgi:hypothetical protein